MIRVMLFLFTNLSVMVLFGSVISVLGCFTTDNNLRLMSIAGIFGLGGAFISLILSKSIALASVNGSIINCASCDMEYWLLKTIHNQSKQLNIVTPQLAIYNSCDINAFATGSRKNDSVIAFSSALLENMDRESIEAVIAHEMNHIISGDMITMTLMQGIVNTFVIFISRSLASLIYYWITLIIDEENEIIHDSNHGTNDISNSIIYMIISSVLELFFGVFASIIVFWFSRYREFYADAGAARLVGRGKMINALRLLKSHCLSSNISSNSSIVTLCIHSSTNKKSTNFFIYDLFLSHPSLDKRIEALQYGLYL